MTKEAKTAANNLAKQTQADAIKRNSWMTNIKHNISKQIIIPIPTYLLIYEHILSGAKEPLSTHTHIHAHWYWHVFPLKVTQQVVAFQQQHNNSNDFSADKLFHNTYTHIHINLLICVFAPVACLAA